LGRQAVILQAQADGRGGSRADSDRGKIRHQIKAFDARRGIFGMGGWGQCSKNNRSGRKNEAPHGSSPEGDGLSATSRACLAQAPGRRNRHGPVADYDKSAQWAARAVGQWAGLATSGDQSLASVSGAPVFCCSSSNESPSTISRTTSPSGVTSTTARLV